MTWVKLDDGYPDHPKITPVGPLGMALHTAAICYASRYLTDGFVPAAQIKKLIDLDGICIMSNGVSNPVTHQQLTDALTASGAFEEAPGGFMIHDYLDYNPSAADVKAERAKNAAKQAAWKAAHAKKQPGNGVSNPVSNGRITSSRTRSPINTTDTLVSVVTPYQLAEALATVCQMDFKPNKGRLLKEAKQLLDATPPPTPDLLTQYYGCDPTAEIQSAWWWMSDWRGKNGEWPTPAQIRETWGQWTKKAPSLSPATNGNGTAPEGNKLQRVLDRKARERGELE
jgi:hypothetical protein